MTSVWVFCCKKGLAQNGCTEREYDPKSRGAKQRIGGCPSCKYRESDNPETGKAEAEGRIGYCAPAEKCKKCGMKYDGPPSRFPKSGLCPLCDPARAVDREAEREALARLGVLERERREAAIQAAIDSEIQMWGWEA